MIGKVKRPVPATILAAGALLVGLLVLLRTGGEPPPLPPGTAGPGTGLPDGFTVAEGSVQVGPIVAELVDDSGRPVEWFAVFAVLGDPIGVWNDYVRQIGRLLGESAKLPDGTGCSKDKPDGFRCDLYAVGVDSNGRRIHSGIAMDSAPGDVTGRYLIHLEIDPTDLPYDAFVSSAARPRQVSPPERARPLPDIGEPLAPATIAYEGDERKYVLLEGSELVAQWSRGSNTGGFGVLLRVLPDALIDRVAEKYAAQAAQHSGTTEVRSVSWDGTEMTIYRPPSGAGGYAGTIWAVDRPGRERDYIFYSLLND